MERQVQDATARIAGMAGMTREAMPMIRDELLGLIRDNQNPFSEIADAVMSLYTHFRIFDVSDPRGLANLLLQWRDATGQHVGEAGENFRRLVLTYFGPNSDPSKVLPQMADKIFAVATAVGVDPGCLARAMADAGPLLRTVFDDFDTALEFLAVIAGTGGDVDMAGRAVTTFMQRITQARKDIAEGNFDSEAVNLLRVLGITPEMLNNEAFSIGDLIMLAIKNGMKDGKLTEAEINALNFLFGNRIGVDMAMAASAVDEFAEAAREALQDYDGSVNRAANITNDTVGGRLTQAWRTFITYFLEREDIKGITQVIQGLVETLVGLVSLDWGLALEGLKNIGIGILRTMFGLSPGSYRQTFQQWWENSFKPALGQFLDGVSNLNFGNIFVGALRMLDSLIMFLFGTNIEEIARIVGGWWMTYAQPGINHFFENTSFGQGMAGAAKAVWAALVSAFYTVTNPEELKEFFLTMWDSVVDAYVRYVRNGVEPWVKETWDVIVTAMKSWWGNTSDVAQTMWDNFKTGTREAVGNVSTGARQFFRNVWDNFLNPAFVGTWALLENIGAVGSLMWDNFKDGFRAALLGPNGIWPFIENRWRETKDAWNAWVDNVYDIGRNVIEGLIKGMEDAWTNVQQWVTDHANRFTEWWKQAFDIFSPSRAMATIGRFIMQGLRQGMSEEEVEILDDMIEFATKMTDHVRTMAGNIQGIIKGDLANGWSTLAGNLVKTLDTAGVELSGFAKNTIQALGDFGDALSKTIEMYNGNILAALADMLIGVIEQGLIEIAITSAVEIAKALIKAPLTFGATLLAQGPILAAAAVGIGVLNGLRSGLRNRFGKPSYDVGTSYVPYDQVAQVHAGEIIVPRNFSDAIRSGQLSLGNGGGGQTTVQVYLDGQMIHEQVANRVYQGMRSLVKADIPRLA
jgi:hypothetical protein